MCDTLCLRHDDGMWFAKNSDRHPDEAQIVEWFEARRAQTEIHTQYLTIPGADAFAFIGSRPTWLWGCEHGVNEHGVAIGNEKIWTVDRPCSNPPALLGMDIVRLVLERARSADDALEVCTTLIQRHGQGGSGEPHADEPYFSSFLMVDARGGWVVESSNRTWAARPVNEGTAISNRVSINTDWTRASADVPAGSSFDVFRHPKMPTGVADHRLATTRASVARGARTTAADLVRTLRSHGDTPAGEIPRDVGDDWQGFTVCMHRPESHAQTTASMIAHMPSDAAPIRAWASLGNPCVGVFVPVFAAAVPPELADAHTWKRFSVIRGSVEAGEQTIESVRAVLDPVETELWEAADELAPSGDPARFEHFARRAFAPIDGALHRLGV